MKLSEKYGIGGMHTGGGCLHGHYAVAQTRSPCTELECYWLINHCDEHGEPDLQHLTDDQHPKTMFGLDIQNVYGWDALSRFLENKKEALEAIESVGSVRYDDGVDFSFITDFQTGYRLMVDISKEIGELQ